LGLAQASVRPDITSGGLTHLSYTDLGNNANPFHYDAVPLAMTLGNGRTFAISNPSGGTARTELNARLNNDGSAASSTPNDFSVKGMVTLRTTDGRLVPFDGTLVTGDVRGFGFQIMPDDAEFEVEIGITGGSLTKGLDR